MNNVIVLNVFRFILLLILQITIANHVNFMGYINPYIYILFIILFPLKDYHILGIISAFFIGLTLDWFSDSGGVHAAASVILANFRPVVLRNVFGLSYEYYPLRLSQANPSLLFIYISICTVFHHLILFSLEIFNIFKFGLIINKTLSSSVLTILVIFLSILIFSKSKK